MSSETAKKIAAEEKPAATENQAESDPSTKKK
jgi:hypothetical protein